MKTLRDLKPGDTVFVVYQLRSSQTEHKTETKTVASVGRQYGYLGEKGSHIEMKFSLDTGESWHSDWNSRANGYGFDIYLREEDWQREQHESRRFRELAVRLCGHNAYALKQLPPDVVEAMHKVLDESEARP